MRTLLLVLGLAWAVHGQEPPAKMRLLIPAYFYPTPANMTMWETMADAHQPKNGIELVVIVNFNSGQPPAKVDPNYAKVVDLLHGKGVHLLAYVSARYGKTPLADITKALDDYARLHPNRFGGVFIDEQNSDAKLIADYYRPMRQHALKVFSTKQEAPETLGQPVVVTNPGTFCDEVFLKDRTVADVVLIHENAETGKTALGQQTFPKWAKNYRPERFAVLAHTSTDLPAFAKLAEQRRAGYVFATEVKGPPVQANCWETLPKDWKNLLAEVQRLNKGK